MHSQQTSAHIFTSLGNPHLLTLIREGAVGVLPSDTIYGLAAIATDPKAVARLYTLKHRERKPGTTIAASTDQIEALGIKPRYIKAVEHFWPGPISIEMPWGQAGGYIHQGTGRSAFRVVADNSLQAFLTKTGALVTSSANMPGQPPANTLEEAIAYFGDTIDFYVDGGDMSGRAPSTLIRIVDDAIEVVRQGAVHIDETGRIT
jgi:L-threonylcarbamoyladenylate synthase